MVDITVTFAFSVFTFYTLYRCLTSNNDISRQLAVINVNWYIYYFSVALMTIYIGSSVAREVIFYQFQFLRNFNQRDCFPPKQGKEVSNLIHIINVMKMR